MYLIDAISLAYTGHLAQLGRRWAVWWQCPEHSALLQKLPFHCAQGNDAVLALTATN